MKEGSHVKDKGGASCGARSHFGVRHFRGQGARESLHAEILDIVKCDCTLYGLGMRSQHMVTWREGIVRVVSAHREFFLRKRNSAKGLSMCTGFYQGLCRGIKGTCGLFERFQRGPESHFGSEKRMIQRLGGHRPC
jgi:hypothetical protein